MTQNSSLAPEQTFKIAAIPADGVGKEVVAAGRPVLETLTGHSSRTSALDWEECAWGSECDDMTGNIYRVAYVGPPAQSP